jgi:hypothetical protein
MRYQVDFSANSFGFYCQIEKQSALHQDEIDYFDLNGVLLIYGFLLELLIV